MFTVVECPKSPNVANGQLIADTGRGWLDKQIYLCDRQNSYRRRTYSQVAVCNVMGRWTDIPECKIYPSLGHKVREIILSSICIQKYFPNYDNLHVRLNYNRSHTLIYYNYYFGST